jgi:hypothetical protein
MVDDYRTRSPGRLPDFLIVGAMKSGTSSLRHILSHHRQIFIPAREIFFFDIDDIEQHPDFFVRVGADRLVQDYDRNFREYVAWYTSFFNDATDGQIVGESSPTYMASRRAPTRIARLLPDAKLLFMLRDPVWRTYSHYWHHVETGRAIYDFERTLQFAPATLLQRSLYADQIRRYKQCVPDRNLHFILFEAFINDIPGTIARACAFLGLETTVDLAEIATHRNPSRYPRSVRLKLLSNRVFRERAGDRYIAHLPNMPPAVRPRVGASLERLVERVNPLRTGAPPPMKPETRAFLQRFFARENRGIEDLIRMNVWDYWAYMRD